MDEQNKPNFYFNQSDDQSEENENTDRPLTNFLQAKSKVRSNNDGLDEDFLEDEIDPEEQQNQSFEQSDSFGANNADETDDKNNFGIPSVELMDSSKVDSNRIVVALKALRQMEQQLAAVIRLLDSDQIEETELNQDFDPTLSAVSSAHRHEHEEEKTALRPTEGRVIEGVFDGRGMVGSDGKGYLVPPNYASKSKLVEGDMLKLTITPKGSFIYKQIGPIDRSRLIGTLGYDQAVGEYYATTDNRRWNVLKASVTYFRGDSGDEVVLLVPKNAPSKWAAVENIIKRNPFV